MKKLIIALILIPTLSWAHGFERESHDGQAADSYTWSEILSPASNLLVDSSAIHPSGTSLFNVCNYNQNQFKVLNATECVEYKTETVFEPETVPYEQEYCVKTVPVNNKLIKNTYKKCVDKVYNETKGETEGGIITSTCKEYADVPVPQMQKMDVHNDDDMLSFAFSKTYTIPNCDGSDLPDEDVPDTKK